MIHFQHYEPGATIRGSELKPKLDRFLIESLGSSAGAFREEHPGWFSGPDHPSLNYKVQLRGLGACTVLGRRANGRDLDINKSFFGNQGSPDDDEHYRRTVHHPAGVELVITCFEPDLWQAMRPKIQPFFWTHNFGTRQSKGFGSFTVRSIDGTPAKGDPARFLDHRFGALDLPAFELTLPSDKQDSLSGSAATPLEWIRITYGLMKSGFNLADRQGNTVDYYKGFALMYLDRYANDKAFVKANLLPGGQPLTREPRFIRALLGTSDQVQWRNQGKTIKYTHVPDSEREAIARVPSPVLFSVTEGDRVFLLPRPIPQALPGAKYEVSATPGHLQKKTIRVPAESEFAFKDFLTAFAERFNDKAGHWCDRNGYARNALEDARQQDLQPARYLILKRLRASSPGVAP
jgi:hypothetical protein